MSGLDLKRLPEFMEALGLDEEPMAIFYTDKEPAEGLTPQPLDLPTREKEAAGQLDWQAIFGGFSCIIGHIWRARRKHTAAYFDPARYGCAGGAFFLGFMKPQSETIIHYVSTGVPDQMAGEHYLDSPEALRAIFDFLDPRPSPARFCVVKPISLLAADEEPELVAFFSRPEALSGLHQLAAFVTNDPEVVQSPWGSACANLIAWPLHYKELGLNKAVLGGWDPSARQFFKTDELSLTVPLAMFSQMLSRWTDSFLKAEAWQTVRRKIDRSRRAWEGK